MAPLNEEKPPLVSVTISDEFLPAFLKNVLRPQLPYCLPLYRRCQFHCRKSQRSNSGQVWLTSVAIKSSDEKDNASWVTSQTQMLEHIQNHKDHPWITAHIDLSNTGQTQVWMYASWELECSPSKDPVARTLTSPNLPIYRRLFRRLFQHLQTEHIIHLPTEPSEQWQRLKDTGKIISAPYSRSKVIFGTIAECLQTFLEDLNGTNNAGQKSANITREDRGYLKYVVQNPPTTTSVPPSLRFGEMQDQHLQLILDRTAIPRTIETLRQLLSVGLFDEAGTPVSWGLIGKDASLSSLHTEPEYRGQGLAEVVSKELIRKQKEVFPAPFADEGDTATDYVIADVSEKNLPSRRVMEKLGGKVMWRVGWMEVDLDKVL